MNSFLTLLFVALALIATIHSVDAHKKANLRFHGDENVEVYHLYDQNNVDTGMDLVMEQENLQYGSCLDCCDTLFSKGLTYSQATPKCKRFGTRGRPCAC
jgi:hypothetical protein